MTEVGGPPTLSDTFSKLELQPKGLHSMSIDESRRSEAFDYAVAQQNVAADMASKFADAYVRAANRKRNPPQRPAQYFGAWLNA